MRLNHTIRRYCYIVLMMDFFFATICPTLGMIISNLQLASPFKAVLECRKRQNLGPLNPVPLAISFVNLIGVIIFGSALKDKFIVLGVAIGIVLNFLGCTTAMSLLAIQGRLAEVYRMERLIIVGISWYILVAVLFVLGAISDVDALLTVMGASTTVTTVLYYCAPLSTLRLVITLRDASSLYLPMLMMNLISSFLWFSYGLFGVSNVWVYVPNCMGLVVTIAQLAVKFIYSKPFERYNTQSKQGVELLGVGAPRSDDVCYPTTDNPLAGGEGDQITHRNELIGGLQASNGLTGSGIGSGVGITDTTVVSGLHSDDSISEQSFGVGVDISGALLDVVPVAAIALCTAVEDVGHILFPDTPEGSAYLKLSQSSYSEEAPVVKDESFEPSSSP